MKEPKKQWTGFEVTTWKDLELEGDASQHVDRNQHGGQNAPTRKAAECQMRAFDI